MAIPDFSLHSIGVILFGLRKASLFSLVLDEIIVDGVKMLSSGIDDLKELTIVAREFKLDFDDAYQYVAAEKYNLEIVSFDTDFDGTNRGRKTPDEVVG